MCNEWHTDTFAYTYTQWLSLLFIGFQIINALMFEVKKYSFDFCFQTSMTILSLFFFPMPTGSSNSKTNRFQETRLTLRIHRGRRSNSVPRITPPFTDNHLKASKSIETTSLDRRVGYLQKTRTDNQLKVNDAAAIELTTKSPILHMMQITLNRKENMESFLCGQTKPNEANDGRSADGGVAATTIPGSGGSKTIRGVGKRILKVQAKRFRMETKAAKTLAIVVGGFICCWLPFFTMYLARAFCDNCIQPLLFSAGFWLGYCNSAINVFVCSIINSIPNSIYNYNSLK